VENDKSTLLVFSVELDPGKLDNGYKVTIDLSDLGGDSNQKMYDNGKFGDQQSYDGIYSYEYLVPHGTPGGNRSVEISVLDQNLNTIKTQVDIEIIAKKNKGKSSTNIIPGFEYNLVIIVLVSFLVFNYSRHDPRVRIK
jgi:hypothetical protein